MLLAIQEGDQMVDIISLSDPTGNSDCRKPITGSYPERSAGKEPNPTDLQVITQEEVEKIV